MFNYSRKIVFVDSVLVTASVLRDNGDRFYFNRDAGGLWVGDADVNGSLVRLTDTNDQTTGWQYTTEDQTELYDGSGKLVLIKYRDGLEEMLTYSTNATPVTIAPSPNLLIKIQNSFGRSLNFAYDRPWSIQPGTPIYTPMI